MKIKLLVIDDEAGICDSMRSLFEEHGLEVYTALSGNEGLEIFKKEKPQIVILDIMMKGMNGIEVLKSIKKINKSNHVFLLTRIADNNEIVKEAEALGAAGYITKPATLETIEETIMQKVEEVKKK